MQNPGGGATGHAKRAGRWPDPKFGHYTQISSDLQYKFLFILIFMLLEAYSKVSDR
jgi:hypothetical protein